MSNTTLEQSAMMAEPKDQEMTDTIQGDIEFDPTKKKRSRKRREQKLAQELEEEPLQITQETESKQPAEYSYDNLVDRFYARLDQMRSGQEVANKITMEPPKVGRQSIRCGWLNFASNCKSLKRDQKHVMKFVLSELGATGSVGGDNKLVINGRYQAKHIETVLTKYALVYVLCKHCKSPSTELIKEDRLQMLKCNNCTCKYTVPTLKSRG